MTNSRGDRLRAGPGRRILSVSRCEHPAALPTAELLAQTRESHTRRSGPGGQHRNKVETAATLVHLPTGISAEASERRSLAENRRVALHRLRLRLALQHRAPAASDGPSVLPPGPRQSGLLSPPRTKATAPAQPARPLQPGPRLPAVPAGLQRHEGELHWSARDSPAAPSRHTR
ncbi:MAG: peptide chain release factor-like protein [Planctomycetia bacterium]|nr:peptide chain release factor-like protein [Planctomycetia bacterium]